jgi:hypothetical protein
LRCKPQPLDIEGGFVKIEKPLNNTCVIVSETFNIAATISIIAVQNLARRIVQVLPQKIRGAGCDFQISRVVECLRGPRVGRDHEAVPGGNDLVVQMRSGPFGANGKQNFATMRE